MIGTRRPRPGRAGPAARAALVAVVAAVVAAACGAAPAAVDATGRAASVTAPAAVTRFTPGAATVTVPGLSPADTATAATELVTPAPAPASVTAGATSGATTGTAGPAIPDVTAPSPAPGAAGRAVTSVVSVPPATPATAAPPGPVAVDLSRCAGCTVIAARAGVAGPLAAALARTPTGAVLLAARPDGGLAGVINVPYGVSFPPPAGGVLPCDRSGRCFVVARGSDGNAVISVFGLSADGTWRDLTVSGGFRSTTPVGEAVDVTGDGLTDIVVQAGSAGRTVWRLLGWSGDGFLLVGCAAATGAAPPPSSRVSYSMQQCN